MNVRSLEVKRRNHKIRSFYLHGVTRKQLAYQFSISYSLIKKIVKPIIPQNLIAFSMKKN